MAIGCHTSGDEGLMSGGAAFLASLAAEVSSVAPTTGETRNALPLVLVRGPARSSSLRLCMTTSSEGRGDLRRASMVGGVRSLTGDMAEG